MLPHIRQAIRQIVSPKCSLLRSLLSRGRQAFCCRQRDTLQGPVSHWNCILDLGQGQVGTRYDEFFQSRGEWASLSERHIQGTLPQIWVYYQNSSSQTERPL